MERSVKFFHTRIFLLCLVFFLPGGLMANLLQNEVASYFDVPGNGGERHGFLEPQIGASVNCNGITRQMALLTPEIVPGQPVIFRLLISGPGMGRESDFIARLQFGGDLRAFIVPPGGSMYEYMPEQVSQMSPAGTITFQDDEKYRVDIRMAMDPESVSGAAFETVGVYQLQVVLNCVTQAGVRDQQVLGVFQITVNRPQGDDLRAFQILSDHRAYEFLHRQAVRNVAREVILTENLQNMFRQIVEETPSARLRPYAMQILSRYYFATNDLEKGEAYLNRMIDEYPDHLVAEDSVFRMFTLRFSNGERDKAREIFEYVWSHPLYSQRLFRNDLIWQEFVEPRLSAETEPPGSQWMIQQEPGPDYEMETPSAGIQVEGMPPGFELIPLEEAQGMGIPGI